MFRKIITLTLCSCLLVACGKKGYPPPEELSNQEIIDILVKELGAAKVDSWKIVYKDFCVRASKNRADRDACFDEKSDFYNKATREDWVREYNRYILNVSK
ncbi:MAG: hypothetical protein IJR46_00535 [Neisseriaceae bacterium]|nr:hypothetical protein [Neisseriaceae bacterium]